MFDSCSNMNIQFSLGDNRVYSFDSKAASTGSRLEL